MLVTYQNESNISSITSGNVISYEKYCVSLDLIIVYAEKMSYLIGNISGPCTNNSLVRNQIQMPYHNIQ